MNILLEAKIKNFKIQDTVVPAYCDHSLVWTILGVTVSLIFKYEEI